MILGVPILKHFRVEKSSSQAFEMKCYQKLQMIWSKNHITNKEVHRKIQAATGEYAELKKPKLKWFCHISRSSGLLYIFSAIS